MTRPRAGAFAFILVGACAPAAPSSSTPGDAASQASATVPPAPPADPDFQPRAEPRRLAAGEAHTCAVRDDGNVSCWGDNEQGQLGDGTRLARSGPVLVKGVSDAVEVAAGAAWSCARTKKAEVLCWGGRGLDGPGRDQPADAAWRVEGLSSPEEIALGTRHGCARTTGGGVACWGDPNGYRAHRSNARGRFTTTAQPIDIEGVTGLALEPHRSCGRNDDGRVMCWGGFIAKGTEPVWNAAGITDAVEIASASSGTCVLTRSRAILCGLDRQRLPHRAEEEGLGEARGKMPEADGLLAVGYAWGCFRREGGVTCWGRGPAEREASLPREEPFFSLEGVKRPLELAAGANHVCARLGSGEITCQGANDRGQLGFDDGRDVLRPRMLPEIADAVAIDAGPGATCVVRKDGKLQCWGDEHPMRMSSRAPTELDGLEGARAVAVGASHSCAVVAGGQVACWGPERGPQLGEGPPPKPKVKVAPLAAKKPKPQNERFTVRGPSSELLAIRVPSVVAAVKGVSNASAVAVGNGFSCALTPQGAVCWGAPGLGIVPKTKGAVALAASDAHGCVLFGSGKVSCWARESIASKEAPFEIPGIEGATTLRAAGRYVCAIDAAGKPGCFLPKDGARALLVYRDQLSKPVVDIAESDKDAPGSPGHSCAVTSAGHVHCWGNGDRGQLGNGRYELTAERTERVDGIDDATRVAVGAAHTCVLHKSGKVSCWGSPRNQVGVPAAPERRGAPFRLD